MKRTLMLALLGGLLLPSVATAQEVSADTQKYDLSYKVKRTWDVALPAPQAKRVGPSIPIAHANGSGFIVKPQGTSLLVDTDGDGETDARADLPEALIVLQGKTSNGSTMRYAVHLSAKKGPWEWRPAGVVRGKIGNTRVTIIDQNCDGRYDGIGEDAMILGIGTNASYLSEVVNIDEKLYRLNVATLGDSISFSPYTGEVGRLDLLGSFDTKAKLLSAIVRSEDRRFSFDMSLARDGMLVPVGDYELCCGTVGLGTNRLAMSTGHAKAMTVKPDATTSVAWGDGPIRAEFDYVDRGGELVFTPDAIRYYGAAGEEYANWTPIGKSPTFHITDKDTGQEIASAKFPGSC